MTRILSRSYPSRNNYCSGPNSWHKEKMRRLRHSDTLLIGRIYTPEHVIGGA